MARKMPFPKARPEGHGIGGAQFVFRSRRCVAQAHRVQVVAQGHHHASVACRHVRGRTCGGGDARHASRDRRARVQERSSQDLAKPHRLVPDRCMIEGAAVVVGPACTAVQRVLLPAGNLGTGRGDPCQVVHPAELQRGLGVGGKGWYDEGGTRIGCGHLLGKEASVPVALCCIRHVQHVGEGDGDIAALPTGCSRRSRPCAPPHRPGSLR